MTYGRRDIKRLMYSIILVLRMLARFPTSTRSIKPPNIYITGTPIKPKYGSQSNPIARHAGFIVPNIGITKNKMTEKSIFLTVGSKKLFIL